MTRSHPRVFFYGPFVLGGCFAMLVVPAAWFVNPRTQTRDGSDPQPLRDNWVWLLILGGLFIGGLMLVIGVGRAWIRAARESRRPQLGAIDAGSGGP